MGDKAAVRYRVLLARLARELERVEAVAYVLAETLREEGLEDEAGLMGDLAAVARDWADEVSSWLENLVRETGGKEEEE